MTDADVAAIARRQHGLVTRAQATGAAMSRSAIEHRLAVGRWAVVRPGVYVVAGVPDSERQAVLAACLAGGRHHASHLTAARLWGFRLPDPEVIHVVGRHVRLAGVRSHQSTTVVPRDLSLLGAIPLTSPARTLVDCGCAVPAAQVGPVVDDALRRGLVRLADLRRCHQRIDTGPGRRPTLAMRAVLAERQPGHAPGDSQREADLVALLARSDLPAPVLGHRVRVGRRTYKLDLAWPEIRVALEFDGWDTHRTFTAFHRDRDRLRRLVAAGWTIVPVTSRTDLHELLADLTALFATRLPLAG